MRLRPGAEHARHRSDLRHDLHSQRARAVRPRRPLVVRQLRRQLSRPQRRRRCAGTPPTRISSSICPAAPGSGATSTRASRTRCSSIRIRRSPSSRSPRPSRGTSSFSSGSTTCSRSASNIGTPASPIPTGAFTWHKTWQPITMDDWRTDAPRRAIASRAVMTWQIESFTDVGGNKDQEFVKFIDLPSRTPQRFELAINGPQQLLREHGWDTVDAMQRVAHAAGLPRLHPAARRPSSASPSTPTSSTRSGWFSDRTECYLASGRPGAGAGHRLDARTCRRARACSRSPTPDEAIAGIDRINADYDRHARRAAEIARAHFDAARRAADAARETA